MLKYWTWHLIAKYVQKLERHKQHKLNIGNFKMNDVDRAESVNWKPPAVDHRRGKANLEDGLFSCHRLSISGLKANYSWKSFSVFPLPLHQIGNYSNWVTFHHHLSLPFFCLVLVSKNGKNGINSLFSSFFWCVYFIFKLFRSQRTESCWIINFFLLSSSSTLCVVSSHHHRRLASSGIFTTHAKRSLLKEATHVHTQLFLLA